MTVDQYLVFASVVALLVSAVLTYLFSRPDWRWRILDHPNERSLHTTPMPRTGGIAIVVAVALGSAVVLWPRGMGDARIPWIACAAFIVAAAALLDDRKSLPAGLRLAIHFLAAAILLWGSVSLASVDLPGVSVRLLPIAAGIVSLLAVVWMINLYNFMDGMDGLAGGMALIGFGVFAWFGITAQQAVFAGVNAAIATAALGFLLFNFPPARIFMGDTGSSTLGLLAIAMAFWGVRDGLFALSVPLLVFSPFIVDATLTLARRVYRREPFWQAHKMHFYQRLVQSGLGHRRVAVLEYVLMFCCAGSAIGATRLSIAGQWMILSAWCVIYAALFAIVSRRAPLHRRPLDT